MAEPHYYAELRRCFGLKRDFAAETLEGLGFRVYDSGSAFYLWARIPQRYQNAMELNEFLINRAGVAGVPGNAFADSDAYDSYMRFCIAREDEILQGALTKIKRAMSE
jgi:aspartate/methionine/tyrosine aminotransferase